MGQGTSANTRPNEQAVLAIEDASGATVMEAAKSLPQVAADVCADVMTAASKPKAFMPSAQHRMPAPDEGELPEPKPIQQEKTESTANVVEATASDTKNVEVGKEVVCEEEAPQAPPADGSRPSSPDGEQANVPAKK